MPSASVHSRIGIQPPAFNNKRAPRGPYLWLFSVWMVSPARMEKCARPTEKARSEEHTSELQSLMRISYAVFCLKKKKQTLTQNTTTLLSAIQHQCTRNT